MTTPRHEVILTGGAERDLEAIVDFVASDRSPSEAEALLEAIVERIVSLESFPRRGAVPKELARLGIRDFRQLIQGPYRLIYRVAGDKVFVLVIADGRRDMQALLERRLLGGG